MTPTAVNCCLGSDSRLSSTSDLPDIFGMASWRNGYAEDCKSLHPGSIPGEASSSIFYPIPRVQR